MTIMAGSKFSIRFCCLLSSEAFADLTVCEVLRHPACRLRLTATKARSGQMS